MGRYPGVGLRQVLGDQAAEAGAKKRVRERRSAVETRFRRVGGPVLASAGMLAALGCGNTYRPVVAAINPVGPAAQPQKYAVAISSPSQTPVAGPTVFVGTWNGSTSYTVNQSVSYNGVQYVSLKSGNVGQNPSTASGSWAQLSNGLATIVDFSGDTVLITAALGVNPYYFTVNSAGTTGYTLNSDKTVNSFDISNQLISSEVLETTLLPGSAPANLLPTTSTTYIADPGLNQVDELTGTPPALKQPLPVAANPLWVVGASGSIRNYVLSAGNGTSPGQATAIESGDNTISAVLPVGRNPTYGIMSSDLRRAYVLNKGDNTVSVINTLTNTADPTAPTINVGVAPVWADVVPTQNQLVVANQGTGASNGSVSVISVPLCSASAQPSNPNCDPNNPVDAATFGTVLANIPVGQNPIMIGALADGTQAYVANEGIPGLPCAANGVAVPGVSTTCTISVINLTTDTVTATIPVNGHPVYLAVTTGTPTGKVYVVCNDSQVMTVIETDTNTVDTTIPLQGFGVSVRVTKP